jgi:hypothetical protein
MSVALTQPRTLPYSSHGESDVHRRLPKLLQNFERGHRFRGHNWRLHKRTNVGVIGCRQKILGVQDPDHMTQITLAHWKTATSDLYDSDRVSTHLHLLYPPPK